MCKQIKSIISVLMAGVMTIGLLAGCGEQNDQGNSGNGDKSSKTAYVRYYSAGYGSAWLEALAEKFNEIYADEGYKFKLDIQPGTNFSAANEELKLGAERNDVDMYFTNRVGVANVLEFSENVMHGKGPLLEPLEDIFNAPAIGADKQEEDKTIAERMFAGAENSMYLNSPGSEWDGQMFCLPYNVGCNGIIMNPTVLEKYNLEIPKTTDELLNVVKTIQEKGSADALKRKWLDICAKQVAKKHFSVFTYMKTCKAIVNDFDNLPLTDEKKPRVGIVGEILVKYMPLANGNLVERLEQEGAEAVVPDFLDFFIYSGFGRTFRHKNLGGKLSSRIGGQALGKMLNFVRKPATKALKKSKRFEPSTPMKELAKTASRFISIGNQYGEGWFLTAEMVHFIENGVPNIVCIQPFGCLPNHIVGKGVLKAVRSALPEANIATVDYDPGASEVNQLNRIKLMLSTAQKNLEKDK